MRFLFSLSLGEAAAALALDAVAEVALVLGAVAAVALVLDVGGSSLGS